jgi:hypothetical protein
VKLVADAPVPPIIVPATPPDAYATIPYQFQVEAYGEPAPNFVVQSGTLPGGLAINPSTGLISGTPTSTSPAFGGNGNYTFTVAASNGATDTETYTLHVSHVLHPPHLTLTPPVTVVGSDPFGVTATFDVPVSGLQSSQIDVIGGSGTVSPPVPVSPFLIGVTPFATVWTFNVTPASSLASGALIETYIRTGAALSEQNASTYAESDTVRVTYQYDQPAIVYPLPLIGTAYISDPGSFYFDVIPNGTGAGAGDIYVDNAPANGTSIRNAFEIWRNGVLYTDWTIDVSGTRITVNGLFGRGDYEVVLKSGRVGNNAGKFLLAQTVAQFSVQLSTSWYEGCEQAFAVDYMLTAAARTLTVTYSGLTGYLTAPDGGSPVSTVNLPAGSGQTGVEFAFRILAVPEEQEGDSVAITITDPLALPVTYWIKLYNRPRVEDVVFIPATTRYPGYFKLIKGGSPALRRSFDAGQHWSNAWAPATDLELADAGGEILLREPDGCSDLAIPLDVSISPTVRRSISLSAAANIVVTPGGSEYSVFSGADFEFRVSMTGPLADRKPHVTTDRQHVPDSVGVIVEADDDGSFTVRLRAVREPVHVVLQAGDLLTGNGNVETTRVWASDGQLYITAVANGRAEVYTPAGTLLKSVDVAAGQTVRAALPPGFFVVRLDGRSFKVGGF